MKIIRDRKGFTLVELLAVIVILAIVMGIAAYSMQGVTENVRISSMKSSALSLVDGVRNELLSTMNLSTGDYYIGKNLLDKETSTPWNTTYKLMDGVRVKKYVKADGGPEQLSCTKDGDSFVRITGSADTKFEYEVCLHDDAGHYVYAKETKLLETDPKKDEFYLNDSNANGVIIGDDGNITKLS